MELGRSLEVVWWCIEMLREMLDGDGDGDVGKGKKEGKDNDVLYFFFR